MGTPYQEKIKVDLWNDHYSVGTEVTVRVYDGEVVTTTTDRPARLLDGRAVVGLAGVVSGPTGEVDLAKVSPVRINCGRTSSVALELAELSPERT